MIKYLVILLALIFIFTGPAQAKQNNPAKTVLATVNNYEITQEEFENEYNESSFARTDTPQARKEFLDNLINRKLILQEAQLKGLDKDKAFLKMIEKFCEQSLLKLAIEQKSKEIAGQTLVSDKEVEEAYQKMQIEDRAAKPYDKMYNQLKWDIAKGKETELLNKWLEKLHKDADIKIND